MEDSLLTLSFKLSPVIKKLSIIFDGKNYPKTKKKGPTTGPTLGPLWSHSKMETGKLLVPLHDAKKGWGVLFLVKFQVVSHFTKKTLSLKWG